VYNNLDFVKREIPLGGISFFMFVNLNFACDKIQ